MDNSKYSYDGTTESNDGTMLYALDNIVPDITADTLHEYKFSIKFEDTNADGKIFTVKNCEIVDEKNDRVIKPQNVFSFALDGSSKTVEYPEIEKIAGIIGDSDASGKISITDATLIQRYVAKIVDESQLSLDLCDCDGNLEVAVNDATIVQRYLAGYDTSSFNIGKNK